MAKVFCISDIHLPFHNKKSLEKIYSLLSQEKPTHVIQVGDLLDQYVFSKYPRSMGYTPDNDVFLGAEQAKTMWEKIRDLLPKAKCFQLLGNHDVRMAKRIQEKIPELSDMFSHQNIYKFPGVTVLKSDRDFLKIDGVFYVHGWLSKSIDHARYFNAPCVHGHRHRPCIEFDRPDLWSMDVGFMADEKQIPLQYTQSKYSRWTMACGVVDNKQPRLILL